MRIVVHGQQAFGRAVLERLLQRGEDVVAICTAPDKEGRRTDPLKELAVEKGLTNVMSPPNDVVAAGPDRSYADMMNYLRWEEALGHKYEV